MKFSIVLLISILIILSGIITSCQNEAELDFKRYYSAGQVVYQAHCQNCHGSKGEGLNSLIPPLTDTAFINSNRKVLPCIIKNGLKGSINIQGKTFDQEMPAQNDLSPIEIAQVVTYITNSYGNKLSLIEVQEVENASKDCSSEPR